LVTTTPVVSTETAILRVALPDGKVEKFKVDSLSNFRDLCSRVSEKVEDLSIYTIHYTDEEEDVVLLDDDASLDMALQTVDDKRITKVSLQHKKKVRAQASPGAASDTQEVHAEAGAEDVAREAAPIYVKQLLTEKMAILTSEIANVFNSELHPVWQSCLRLRTDHYDSFEEVWEPPRYGDLFDEKQSFDPVSSTQDSGESLLTEAAVGKLADQCNKLVNREVKDIDQPLTQIAKLEGDEDESLARPAAIRFHISPQYFRRCGDQVPTIFGWLKPTPLCTEKTWWEHRAAVATDNGTIK
jgi:hypothetical protein